MNTGTILNDAGIHFICNIYLYYAYKVKHERVINVLYRILPSIRRSYCFYKKHTL